MPPKKKDKDGETSKQPKVDHLQADHELFLQAFEKPTQIYRYLRTRNIISPIFLNRNLSYMRSRMSRSHKNRNTFKIDSMLCQKMNKIRNEKTNGLAFSGDYLTLIFLGFYDKNEVDIEMENENGTVKVETILLKISHNKRKDISSALKQAAVGSSDVVINPKDKNPNANKVPAVSIPTESFASIGGPLHLSFILLFRIQYYPNSGGGNKISGYTNGTSTSEDEIVDEPSSKKQKLNHNTKLYGTELIIFDKFGRCLLTEGDYELSVQEILQQQLQVQKYNSPKKNSTWEPIQPMSLNGKEECDIIDIFKQQQLQNHQQLNGAGNINVIDDFNPFHVFSKCPILKFRIQWTKEALIGLVDRPQPIIINLNNNINNDKENHKPDQLSPFKKNLNLNININNNSILTSTSNSATSTSNGGLAITGSAGGITGTSSSSSSNEVAKLSDDLKIDHIIYQFVYNNNSRQQTETVSDFHCPWCSLNCESLYPLMKHLKLCHARFIFSYVPIPNGARIDVSINELYDGSYNGSPHDLLGTATAFSRRGPVRRTVVTNILVCRPRRQKHSLSEFLELDENEFDSQRPYITGHNRLYHHTMTCLPVHPKELDIDSEGESDPLWLQYKTKQMIDEFTDVNEGEKELMKMWNLHVMKYGYVGDCQISVACDMFIEIKGIALLEKNLYRNFVLHMCSLFDFGLVSPECMQKTIRKLQKILFENPHLQKVMADSRKDQMEYWTKMSANKQLLPPKKEKVAEKSLNGISSTSKIGGSEKKVKSVAALKSQLDKKVISPPRRRSACALLIPASASNIKKVIKKSSPITTRRKSLSIAVGTQRKRSLN